MEKPGYRIEPFVKEFHSTAIGPVPRIETTLSARDKWQTAMVRMGFGRNSYTVTPGLYSVGAPDRKAPIIVTANYKLTFDAVRRELGDLDCWLLVVDTRGINVWCAAGKGLFSTAEVIYWVQRSRLAEVVDHRTLTLPQLAAPGVAAHEVRKGCGFRVEYGPIRAVDLPAYFQNNGATTEEMRLPTFTFKERAELIPVELFLLGRSLFITLVGLFILSGIGPFGYSLTEALYRGGIMMLSTCTGIVAGAVAAPLLLSVLPGRMFSIKGAITGIVAGLPLFIGMLGSGTMQAFSPLLWTVATASWMAMNFTGSTPFTSPSGVEREMRLSMPFQAAIALLALTLWLAAPFTA